MTSEYDRRLKLQEEQFSIIIQENDMQRDIEETAKRDLDNLKEDIIQSLQSFKTRKLIIEG